MSPDLNKIIALFADSKDDRFLDLTAARKCRDFLDGNNKDRNDLLSLDAYKAMRESGDGWMPSLEYMDRADSAEVLLYALRDCCVAYSLSSGMVITAISGFLGELS